jgi:hypothetical protein
MGRPKIVLHQPSHCFVSGFPRQQSLGLSIAVSGFLGRLRRILDRFFQGKCGGAELNRVCGCRLRLRWSGLLGRCLGLRRSLGMGRAVY